MVFRVCNTGLPDQLFVARVVNVFILLGLLFSLHFFLKEFTGFYARMMEGASAGRLKVSESNWYLLGGCLFAWLFLSVGAINQTTPDYLIGASMLCGTGIVLQIARSPAIWRFALLGAVLGLGYLSKASMIPAAVTMIALAAAQPPLKNSSGIVRISLLAGTGRAAVAFAVFCVVSSPYVAAMAQKKGEFEIGSSAGLNYMMSITCQYRPLGPNRPELIRDCPHPIANLSSEPDLAVFDSPLNVTYPPWFDPAFFADGLKVTIDPVASVVSLLMNAVSLYALFGWQATLAWLVGVAICRRSTVKLSDAKPLVIVWLAPAVTMLAISAVINLSIGWTTQRYFPPMVLILYLTFIAVSNFRNDERGRQALKLSIGIVCGAALVLLAMRVSGDIGRLFVRSGDKSVQIASWLLSSGLRPGEKVAMIGNEGVEWARLADLKIVAQVIPAEKGNAKKWEPSIEAILYELSKTNARAVVYFARPYTEYLIDQNNRTEKFRAMISKFTGGNPPEPPPRVTIPPDTLKEWKKLDGAEVYFRRL